MFSQSLSQVGKASSYTTADSYFFKQNKMLSKVLVTLILLVCGMILIVDGYPYPLSDFGIDSSNNDGDSLSVQLLTRALEEDSNFVLTTSLLENKASSDNGYDENPNDLELAEVNVFRPVFRYRVSVSKKVKGPPQF
ncbi:uncharacterized protein LOC129951739 isoform X2 [Eupeodes corollae]|uniref:uncharacterized protein LOC129951739 isoform X2 n=1 Tax=Eupeodes corollae TaxID=290404 RepID=UPI0024933030|nr:uncharacterized protein LOC129951739 isoform X2 [Eupeodes corollae]